MPLNSKLAAKLKRVEENDPALTEFKVFEYGEWSGVSEAMLSEYVALLVPALARNTVIDTLNISTDPLRARNESNSIIEDLRNSTIEDWRLAYEKAIDVLGALKKNTSVNQLFVFDISPDDRNRHLSSSEKVECPDDDLVDALSDILAENATIDTFILFHVVQDDAKAKTLARALTKSQKLERLRLILLRSQLTPLGLGNLFESVKGKGTIDLRVSTHQWEEGIQQLVHHPLLEFALKENAVNIGSLVIEGSNSDKNDLRRGWYDALKRNNKIKSLSLQNVSFGDDESWRAFASSLTSNNSIIELSFADIELLGSGLGVFVNELEKNNNQCLETLDFRNCEVCDMIGAQALSLLFIKNRKLRDISINGDAFDDEGVTTLARTFKENETSLNSFSYVEEDDDGEFHSERGITSTALTVLLTALLESKVGIHSIVVNTRSIQHEETDLDRESIDVIANALKTNQTIEDFHYYGSDHAGNMAVAVAGALLTNRSLKEICLDSGGENVKHADSVEMRIFFSLEIALEVNHFVSGDIGLWNYGKSKWRKKVSQLLSWNAKGELYATIMKGYQFPVHFIKDLPDSSIPETIAQVDKKAQLNGIFSFIQSKQDAVFAGLGDSSETDKKVSGKRKSAGYM